MLFIKIEQYGWDVSLFGHAPKQGESGYFGNRLHLNEHGYRCDYQRFESLPRMYGNSFESVEVMGKRLVGYIHCPYWAHSQRNPVHADLALPELLIFYVNAKVDTDFQKWLRQNPLIRVKSDRTHMGIFRTYEGELLQFYLQQGKLAFEPITENSFVYEGHITTLAEVREKQLEEAHRKVRAVEEFHAKLDERFVDLPKTLDGHDLAHFVKTR